MISEFMIRATSVEQTKPLFQLGSVAPVGQENNLYILTLTNPTKSPKKKWKEIQSISEAVVAVPVIEGNSYPTGHIGVYLKRGANIHAPIRLTTEYNLCFVEQSKHIPEMFLYALTYPKNQYIIDVVKQLCKDKEVRAAWLNSLVQFNRS